MIAHLGAALLTLAIVFPASAADAPLLPSVSSGRIERIEQPSQQVPSRLVDVWLPVGYPEAAPYAVLYMHDGQMLFDAATTWNKQEWRVDETASTLIAQGQVAPFIVVGVWNGGQRRHPEFFPQGAFDRLPEAMQTMAREASAAAGEEPVSSDAYLRFLVTELKPVIDTRYAVHTGPAHTYIAGSSMGGLISMAALTEYPQVFGGAACMSTHWPGIDPSEDKTVAHAILQYIEERFPVAGTHRIWFDHGTGTLDAHYPALQAEVDKLMRNKGYGAHDWQTRVDEGAEHNEVAWANRLGDALVFLMGSHDAASAAESRR